MAPNIRPLTQEQRQAAYRAAQEAVVRAVGPKPARQHFTHTTISRYPPSITRLISGLCLVLLLAAFTPSAIRLYVIGSHTFGQAVSNHVAKMAVGLATILSAEIGQVVFSLALATLGTSQTSRRLLYVSMSLSTVVSLVGNVQLALPGHAQSPFAWLEAMVPPLLVLATSFVLKEQLLGTIETRHANEQAFQTALADWQVATASPEKHTYWQQYYANALRDALRKANRRRTEVLSQMTQGDWCTIVAHEMQAERWYEQPIPGESSLMLYASEAGMSPAHRNGNGLFPKGTAAG
jgi:hypothetical protein